MSILQQTGTTKTVTEGSLALQYFTDRYEKIITFLTYINEPITSEKILFFCGDGGNGKSLLIKFLRSFYCKKFKQDNWDYLKSLANEDLIANLKEAQDIIEIPSVLIDFGMQNSGDDRPQEAFSALSMLRRQLRIRGLDFPLYDFACL